jgi:hypothetical protein
MEENTMALALLFSVLVGEIVCAILLSCLLFRNDTLNRAIGCINEFALASLAYQSSKEIGPGVGPAILRQVREPMKEEKEVIELPKTGVTIRTGRMV